MRTRTILFLASFSMLAGCSNKLETGYEPRALNSTSTVRRGYYASPFTPEAKAAEDDRTSDIDAARRPRPGY